MARTAKKLTRALVRVIDSEDESQVRALVESLPLHLKKQVVDGRPGAPCTPLVSACLVGSLSILRYLLHDLGADPNVPRYDGATPLHITSANTDAHVSLLDELLQAGANVNARDKEGDTPLHVAVIFQSLEHVQRLIEHGAEVDTERGHPRTTPLLIATYSNQTDIAAYLLSQGADPNKVQDSGSDKITPLYAAALQGNLSLVNLLLDAGADPFYVCNRGYTTLMCACDSSSVNPSTAQPLEVVRRLLDVGVPVNSAANYGSTALYIAASRDLSEVIMELTTRGAEIEASVPTSVQVELDLILPSSKLRECYPEFPRGVTPLQIAAQEGCLNAVRALIDAGANVNSTDGAGTTPLIAACRNGASAQCYQTIIEELIDAGAVVNHTNKLGENPKRLANSWLNWSDPLWKKLRRRGSSSWSRSRAERSSHYHKQRS